MKHLLSVIIIQVQWLPLSVGTYVLFSKGLWTSRYTFWEVIFMKNHQKHLLYQQTFQHLSKTRTVWLILESKNNNNWTNPGDALNKHLSKALRHFGARSQLRWSVFLMVDCGYGRDGTLGDAKSGNGKSWGRWWHEIGWYFDVCLLSIYLF